MNSEIITIIDPPQGYLYGFPKELPKDKTISEFLRESNYPEKDIDFARQHLRSYQVRVHARDKLEQELKDW